MTNETLAAIAAENTEEGFEGPKAVKRAAFVYNPDYRVLNQHPTKPDAEFKAGIRISKKVGETYEAELVETPIQAVILFLSPSRKFKGGQAVKFKTLCQSHDGQHPSQRIDDPVCRKASKQDIVNILSSFKNTEKAKVDASVAETCNGDKLQMCGLPMGGNTYPLCPAARKDEFGRAGPCRSYMTLRCWDIKRSQEFNMEIGGGSIANGKFISPLYVFLRYLQSQGPKGLPCYAFSLKLSSLKEGNGYILNITDIQPIENAENRALMKARGIAARDLYERQSHMLSKEAYDKSRQSQPASTAVHQGAEVSKAVTAIPAEPVATTFSSDGSKEAGVSFDSDDIPF